MSQNDPVPLNRILSELAEPDAYNHPVGNLRAVQTHTSCVFLTGKYAYKVKKPVNFEFLDYSTLEKRRKFCEKEIELNRRLCPEIYLNVVPITEQSEQLRIGGSGPAIEWAVQMLQLPESDMLPVRLRSDSVSASQIKSVAGVLADFHGKAVSNPEIRSFGMPESIGKNVRENFEQTERFIGPALTRKHFTNIKHYMEQFLAPENSLLLQRVKGYHIRDGHGDLRAQNICLCPSIQDGIQIFDCIEFNDRFRYEDVAADVAYLAMDLDLSARADLRRIFMDAYVKYSGDSEINSILQFYQCYRAFVRGKIALLTSTEPEIPPDHRKEQEVLAGAAFDLANSYALRRSPPGLFIMTGISGSGKSVIARELARRVPAVLLSSDRIRKELAGMTVGVPLDASWYRQEKMAMVYEELRNRGRSALLQGEHVILDATFLSSKQREAAAALASSCGAAFHVVDCRCDEKVARVRIEARSKLSGNLSDATTAVLQEQLHRQEPVHQSAIVLNTEQHPQELAKQVLKSI